MKNLLVLLIVGFAVWTGYRHFSASEAPAAAPIALTPATMGAGAIPALPVASPGYTCDGRTHCSQMRSCAEATYFMKHCPGTQMDGNNDGEPCEQQWCQ